MSVAAVFLFKACKACVLEEDKNTDNVIVTRIPNSYMSCCERVLKCVIVIGVTRIPNSYMSCCERVLKLHNII